MTECLERVSKILEVEVNEEFNLDLALKLYCPVFSEVRSVLGTYMKD